MSEKSSEKKLTSNPFKAEKTIGRIKNVLRNAPVIGTVADVVDIGKELVAGDYAGAAVAAGTTLAGVTPIGRIASKGAKVVSQKLKKKPVIKEDVPTVEAAGLTDEDIIKFRKPESEGGRGTSPEFREALKGRNPELQELAKKVKEGKISVKEYRNRADEIRPIRLVSEVPKPATNKEIVSALNSKQRQNPLIGLNATIPEKDIVEVRLNIPAYTDYNVWIPTIRHNKKEKYKAAVRIQNVQFIQPDSSGSKKALNVATGVEKAPFAVMTGEYVDGSDDELFNIAKKVFDDNEWTQVGYDPIKRGFFYDRATGEAILEADEVIQVGHLVLAKNAKKTDPDAFSFNQGGIAMKKQMDGVLKAHQGTIVNGQIVYPTISQAPADPEPIMPTEGLPNPFVTNPTTQIPTIKMDESFEKVVAKPLVDPAEDYAKETFKPLIDPAVVSNPVQIGQTKEQLEAEGKLSQPIQQMPTGLGDDAVSNYYSKSYEQQMPTNMMPGYGGAGIPPMATGLSDPTFINQSRAMLAQQPAKKNMTFKEFFGGKAVSLKDFLEQKNKQQLVSQFSKDFNLSQKSEQIQKPITDKLLEVRQKYLPKLNELEFKLQNNLIDQKEFETQYRPITQLMANEMNNVKMQNLGLMQDVKLQQDNLQKEFEDAFFKQYKPVGQGNTISKPMPFNEGGAVMEKQMEMNFGEKSDMSSGTFLFNEGGMKDDGGEKDPVSGNDVPSGSLAKEVRDDVPAMVSEGEFIFPADVVRYIGLDKLMKLRQEAKMGLKKMEMMGQLGNPEEAVLPDDIPFDASDILIVDEEDDLELDNLNQGGIIGFQEGTANAGEQANQYYDITDEANKKYAKRYVYYKNDAGQTMTILSTFDGTPLEPVPAGYKIVIGKDGLPATELPKDEDIEEKKPEVEQPTVQQRDDDDGPEAQPFYSTEYLADKFKGDVIYDANGNPRSLTEQGYLSTQTSANRLGLDMNTYFNLPMSAKMDMLGQEFAGMFGKEVDQDYINNIVEQVKAGTYKGKGIAGYIGGIGDWISSWFGNDNPDAVQKKIKQTNKATGNITPLSSSESPKFTGSVGDALRSQQDRQEKFAKQRRSNESKRTRITASKNQSDKSNITVDPTASREDRVTQAKAKSKVKTFEGVRDSSGKKEKLSGEQMKAGVDVGSGVGGSNLSGPFNKGTLVTKRPPTNKKPTKGKTLVTKRS